MSNKPNVNTSKPATTKSKRKNVHKQVAKKSLPISKKKYPSNQNNKWMLYGLETRETELQNLRNNNFAGISPAISSPNKLFFLTEPMPQEIINNSDEDNDDPLSAPSTSKQQTEEMTANRQLSRLKFSTSIETDPECEDIAKYHLNDSFDQTPKAVITLTLHEEITSIEYKPKYKKDKSTNHDSLILPEEDCDGSDIEEIDIS